MAVEENLSRDRVLYQVAAELTSSLDLDEVLSRVMDRVIDLMHASRGFIVLIDPDRNELQVRMARGEETDDATDELLDSRTVVEQVLMTGFALVTTDASLDDRFIDQQLLSLHHLPT